jgi:Ca2+-binding RTX toxin-like protein
MTSSLSSATIDATASVGNVVITGGAGNDIITAGTASDSITAGTGADTVDLRVVNTAGNLHRIYLNDGDSNAVMIATNGVSTGQDIINFFDTAGALGLDELTVTGTSTDASWVHSTHVLVGTAGATQTVGDPDSFLARTVLVQFGNPATTSDAFDIVVDASLDAGNTVIGNLAAVQAVVSVNLTGSAAADTLTMGNLGDTVAGGAGADTILGGTGADVLDGGAGNDILDYNAATGSLNVAAGTSPTAAEIDTVTVSFTATNNDTIDLVGFNTSAIVDATAGGTVQAVPIAAGAESTGTSLAAAIQTAITGAANEVTLIKVTDSSTDTSFNGDFDGYYLVANDSTAGIAATDLIIKLVGVTDATTIAVSSADLVTFS